jgi:hypothetical protein
MSDDKNLIDLASANSGWLAAFLAGSWGVILRVLVGRHLTREDEQRKWVTAVDSHLVEIEKRLAVIESRSHNRRRQD